MVDIVPNVRIIKQSGQWIPYQGPRGGSGWQNIETGDVEYTGDPPGQPIDSEEVLRDVFDLDDSTVDGFTDLVDRADEIPSLDGSELMREAVGGLARRLSDIDADPSDLTDEQAQNYFEGYIEREIEEAETRQNRSDWHNIMEDSFEVTHAFQTTVNEVSDLKNEILDRTSLSETAVDEEIADIVRSAIEEESNDFAKKATIKSRVAEFKNDQIATEWEENTEENVRNQLESELSDSALEEIDRDVLFDAVAREFGTFSDMGEAFNDASGDSPSEQIADALTTVYDDGRRILNNSHRFTTAIVDELEPFRNMDTDPPTGWDVREAENVRQLGDSDIKGGRSSSSMFIAEGVPDGEGNKRRLFVTNTNPDRSSAEDPDDGERCEAGSSGFEAAGITVPEYVNVEGEYWAAEDVGGMKVGKGQVDYTDLDNPLDQFVELGAVAAVLGAVDLHEGNVHIRPEDGELIPVDLDLVGMNVADEDARWDNKFSFGQQSLIDRFMRSFNEANMDEVYEEEAVIDMIKLYANQLADEGQVSEIASAATSASDNMDINMKIDENKFALQNGDMWEEPPDPSIIPDQYLNELEEIDIEVLNE